MVRSTVTAIVLAILGGQDAAAQATVLHLGAGRAGYEALESFSTSIVAGLSYAPNMASWASVTLGVPIAAGQDPSWLAAAVETSRGVATIGPARVGLDLALDGYGYRDPLSGSIGTGGTLGALPALRLDRARVGLRIRSGIRTHATASAGYRESRAVHHTDVMLEGRLRNSVHAGVEGRYVRAPEGATPYLGGHLTVRHAHGDLRGELGQWLGSDLVTGTSWSARAAVNLPGDMSLTVGAAHEATDPLYLYEARTSWSLGISRALGGRSGLRGTVPVVPPGDRVRIAVPASGLTGPLHVAGSFSGWQPLPMQRIGDEWVLELDLETGSYRYAVRDGNGRWFVPDNAYRRQDGMGGEVAVIIVSE